MHPYNATDGAWVKISSSRDDIGDARVWKRQISFATAPTYFAGSPSRDRAFIQRPPDRCARGRRCLLCRTY